MDCSEESSSAPRQESAIKTPSTCNKRYDLCFMYPLYVQGMSVVVIFSFLSSMSAGHSSSICSCVSVLLPHALQFRSVFLLW